MSVRAMAWAWDQECPTPAAKLVLLKLADRANDEGECWPSQGRIATDCGLSRKTVNVQIAALEKLGLLETKSQVDQRGQHVSRYFLRCENPLQGCEKNGHPLRNFYSPPEKFLLTHNKEEPISEPISESISRPNRRLDKPDRFMEFYAAYPRHEARGDALKAWVAACKRADAETIIAAARRYAEGRAGEDKRFTKLPATWLRADCWTDEEQSEEINHGSDKQIDPGDRERGLQEALRRAKLQPANNGSEMGLAFQGLRFRESGPWQG